MPGGPSFSLLCLSAQNPNGAMGWVTLSWLIEQCVLGATHLRPSGTVRQPFNYSIPQTRWFKSDKPMAILGCWVLVRCHQATCQEPQPSDGTEHRWPPPSAPHWELGAYAMMLKQSLLDNCSSSRSRRECWIWIMYMELVTEISSSITTLKRNTSFEKWTESLR